MSFFIFGLILVGIHISHEDLQNIEQLQVQSQQNQSMSQPLQSVGQESQKQPDDIYRRMKSIQKEITEENTFFNQLEIDNKRIKRQQQKQSDRLLQSINTENIKQQIDQERSFQIQKKIMTQFDLKKQYEEQMQRQKKAKEEQKLRDKIYMQLHRQQELQLHQRRLADIAKMYRRTKNYKPINYSNQKLNNYNQQTNPVKNTNPIEVRRYCNAGNNKYCHKNQNNQSERIGLNNPYNQNLSIPASRRDKKMPKKTVEESHYEGSNHLMYQTPQKNKKRLEFHRVNISAPLENKQSISLQYNYKINPQREHSPDSENGIYSRQLFNRKSTLPHVNNGNEPQIPRNQRMVTEGYDYAEHKEQLKHQLQMKMKKKEEEAKLKIREREMMLNHQRRYEENQMLRREQKHKLMLRYKSSLDQQIVMNRKYIHL